MKIKEAVFRALAVIFFIGIIGTFGGIEQGFLTWGRGLLQAFLLLGGMVLSHRIANALWIAERRKRKAVRK